MNLFNGLIVQETERAVGGRDKNTVQGTVADTILYETPKRASS